MGAGGSAHAHGPHSHHDLGGGAGGAWDPRDMRSSEGLLATIRVLASDLDGTLLDPHHVPGPGTFEAIKDFQDAGGIFAVCTGRDKGSARGVLVGLDIDHLPGVYMNGTIVQGLGGVPLQSATLPQALVWQVVEWGRTHRDVASILFVDGDVHYVMDRSEEYAMFMHKHLLDPDPIQVEGAWESPSPKIPDHVNMMRVICSPENMAIVKPQIQLLVEGQANFAQSLPTTIDIMAPNTNKATGLSVLLNSLGHTWAHTAAIGDSENDLEMLQSVKVACAMGNAVQKTKAVAHFVMPKNTEDPPGVVCLLRQVTSALKLHPPKPAEQVHVAGPQLRVACFGAGGWGTPVARMVGQSVRKDPQFVEEVMLWVHDEIMEGERLSDKINRIHENPKYLPGLRLPTNLKATSDAKLAARNADILIFVEREEVLRCVLNDIAGEVKKSAIAVVMSKDMVEIHHDRVTFGSHFASERLGIPCAALMGGTLAGDVAAGSFAEATLGCADPEKAGILLSLFRQPNFAVSCIPGVQAVELFAVLKTIVSLASGFCDGVGYGFNTKAAIVRLGAVELSKFARHFYPEQASSDALHEACGWTDLIVSTFGNSRNRIWAEAFAKEPTRSYESIAVDCLPDKKMPTGIRITADIAKFIKNQRVEMEFPFINKIQRILTREDAPNTLISMTVPKVRRSQALQVTVLGSGNWGTAIARIIARNVSTLSEYQKTVRMWVHEEEIDGRKLTEIINTDHVNVKYLPGVELPLNIVAMPDAVEAVKDAHVLIFVLPHQFLDRLLANIAPVVGKNVMAVSLIKGHMVVLDEGRSLHTGSQVIAETLRIPECAVLNGANVADDVAKGNFAEATLGCSNEEQAHLLARLFHNPMFQVRTTPDNLGVELFGGLKNVIALAAGFCDGLGLAANTKAAVLRRGLLEMGMLIRELFPASRPETIEESCGIADLLTTCYSGRNRKCAEAYAKNPNSTWEDIERELLNGQKLQGPSCCLDVQMLIDARGLRERLPLMTAIHAAVTKKISPQDVFTTNGFLA